MFNIILNKFKNNNTSLKKYHVINNDYNIIKCKCCNLYAPFGREINKFNDSKQHRLNIKFSENLIEIITDFENYFQNFNDFKDYTLVSNIINNNKCGIFIRFHLKTFKNNTTTILKHIINDKINNVYWIDFKNDKKINIEFHPDCLWIDEINKKYGISFIIDEIYQIIN